MNKLIKAASTVALAGIMTVGVAGTAFAVGPTPSPTKPYGDRNVICDGMDNTFTQNLCADIPVVGWNAAQDRTADYVDTEGSPYLAVSQEAYPTDADYDLPRQTVTPGGPSGNFTPTINTILPEGSQGGGPLYVAPDMQNLPLYATIVTSDLIDNTQLGYEFDIVDGWVNSADVDSPTSYESESALPEGAVAVTEGMEHLFGDVQQSPEQTALGAVTLPESDTPYNGFDVVAGTPTWIHSYTDAIGNSYSQAGWDLTATFVIEVTIDGNSHFTTRDVDYSATTEWVGEPDNIACEPGTICVGTAGTSISARAEADLTPFHVYAQGEVVEPPVVEPPVVTPPVVEPPVVTPPVVEPPVVTPPVVEPPVVTPPAVEEPPAISTIKDGGEDTVGIVAGILAALALMAAGAVAFIRNRKQVA